MRAASFMIKSVQGALRNAQTEDQFRRRNNSKKTTIKEDQEQQ